MARAVDEQPCEESKKNEQRNSESVEVETDSRQCHHEDSQTALLNEVNTHNSMVNTNTNASTDCKSFNSIPDVSIKEGYTTEDERGPYEIVPCSKEKMLELSVEDKVELSEKGNDVKNVAPQPTWRLCATITVLLLANVLNYMDRYTIAGILPDIMEFYQMTNSEAGLLQTVFIISYMILSPIFGYMGDRYNRKFIMAAGIFFWSLVTLAGSFVPSSQLWTFMLLRGMVGVGEASYSTIAPTIISDLFLGNMRTVALTIFYFAIPVGSGLGYIVGANVAHALGHWQWALRVTPVLGVLCVIGILVFVREPPRGALEGGAHLHTTTWAADIKHLFKNKSFILSTLGFTCVTFVAGALAFWGVHFIKLSIDVQGEYMQEARISLIFGVITCLAGFFGVGIGTLMAKQMRGKIPEADPIVCAFGLIAAAPFLYFAIIMAKTNTNVTWVMIFIGETFLCLNWAIVTDMLLYIVVPTRRSTAEAFQILVSHAFGDAGSPYLVGSISDVLHGQYSATVWDPAAEFLALQNTMYITCFVSVLGGFFFLITALYINQDKARADKVIKDTLLSAELSSSTDQSSLELTNIVTSI